MINQWTTFFRDCRLDLKGSDYTPFALSCHKEQRFEIFKAILEKLKNNLKQENDQKKDTEEFKSISDVEPKAALIAVYENNTKAFKVYTREYSIN